MSPPLLPRRHAPLDLPVDSGGYAFNPALFRTPAGFGCIYRHVGADQSRKLRRCSLDDDFRVQSYAVWSDEASALGGAVTWYADPRVFAHRDRWHVTFNTGHSESPNSIYISEIDNLGRPTSAPRKVMKLDGRRKIEKNWGFFDVEGVLYCIYSISPFVVLRLKDDFTAQTFSTHYWHAEALEQSFGQLRGGASPVRVGDMFYVALQSHSKDQNKLFYSGSMMTFEALPPFKPRWISAEPLLLLDGREAEVRPAEPLNPRVAQCIYPSGSAIRPETESLVVTYGINDFRSGLREYALPDLRRALRPVTSIAQTPYGSERFGLRTFFWQPEISASRSEAALGQGVFRLGNAGDTLQRLIATRLLGGRAINTAHGGRRVLGVGSISHRMQAGDIIWGSGFKPMPPTITREEAQTVQALAVRGPLTRDYLARHGVDTSRLQTFLDPGLLIGEFLGSEVAEIRSQAEPARGPLYLPHYSDTIKFAELYRREGYKVGSMDADILDLVRQILESTLVISSSLHGVIFAEALGVPAIVHRPPKGEHFEKYVDYYAGTDRFAFPIMEDGAKPGSLRAVPPPRIPPNWRETLPARALLRERGALVPADRLYAKATLSNPEAVVEVSGQSDYVIDVSQCLDEGLELLLTTDTATPVLYDVRVGDQVIASGRHDAIGRSTLALRLDTTPAALLEGLIRIRLRGASDPQAVGEAPRLTQIRVGAE